MTAAISHGWTPENLGYVRAVADSAPTLASRYLGEPGPITDYWRKVVIELLDTVKELTDA